MTIRKIKYKCSCGYEMEFEEDVTVIRAATSQAMYFLPLESYPKRICEKCGLEMERS